MNYFLYLIEFIEAFLFSIFIAKYFQLKHQSLFISITSLSQWLVLMFIDGSASYGLMSTVMVTVIMLISLIIFKRDIQFDYFYIVILYMSLIVILKVVSMFICGFFLGRLSNIENYAMAQVIFQRCTAKTLQIAITYWLIKEKIDLSTSFDFANWSFMIGIDLFFIMGMTICLYAILSGNSEAFTFTVLLLIMMNLSILYRKTMNKMNTLNAKQVEYTRIEALSKSNKQKIIMVNQMKKEIEDKEHRSYYMLYLMEHYLKQKDYNKLEDLIDKYKDMLGKSNVNIDTGNYIFDYFYGIKINELIRNEINVENSICISKNQGYNEISFINWLNDLLDYFKECKELKIFINESGTILTIKIIYREGAIQQEKVASYLDKTKITKINYNLDSHEVLGLRLSLDVSLMML